MDPPIYGVSIFLLLLLLLLSLLPPFPAAALPTSTTTGGQQINSNSVLVALLDSHYTELSELIEKALLLPQLESAVSSHNLTIFAPQNDVLHRRLDPEFKRFLLEPRNLKSLQTLLLHHILPSRVGSPDWPHSSSAAVHHLRLSTSSGQKLVESSHIVKPDDLTRPDGVIHGIDRLLVPHSVQEDFNRRRSLRSISAVLPEGAPEVDPRTHRLKKVTPVVPAGAPPVLPI